MLQDGVDAAAVRGAADLMMSAVHAGGVPVVFDVVAVGVVAVTVVLVAGRRRRRRREAGFEPVVRTSSFARRLAEESGWSPLPDRFESPLPWQDPRSGS